MANSFGERFRITTFGESHGPAVGVVIDGVAPNVLFDLDEVQRELDRRRPGQSPVSTPRKEADRLEVLSGIFEGRTTGAPIALLIRNTDAKPKHYEEIRDRFRPGHADFTYLAKYGIRDWRGGGRSSARETAVRVAAGALAKQLLASRGVRIHGHTVRIGTVAVAEPPAPEALDPAAVEANPVRCAEATAAERMVAAVDAARKDGDSLGGVVEVVALGVPPGWGDPVYQKLSSELAAALCSIPAVKGVEFGDGFALAARRGSEVNDAITPTGFASNHAGGLLGGISNGAPLVLRVAAKPTASIRVPQQSVDTAGNPATIRVPGRHDPCIVPRLVPVAEAMVAITLCDAMLRQDALEAAKADAHTLTYELAQTDAALLALMRRREALRAEATPADEEASREQLRKTRQRVLGEFQDVDGTPSHAAKRLHEYLTREDSGEQEE